MTKYRVTFIYGSWHLWADIERPRIANDDRKGFADIAQLAVNIALDELTQVERNHIAHDYVIFEVHELSSEELSVSVAYSFDSLVNE